LRVQWLAATLERDRLDRAGGAGNAVYLYLVSDRPFDEALVP
jgi:hypothetical protein